MRRRLAALVLVAVAALAGSASSATERDDAPPVGELVAATPSPSTPVLSARRVPALLAAPIADRRLAEAVAGIVARQEGVSCLTVASAGRRIVATNDDVPLVPASLVKLVTAVAALDVLGPDHRFRTSVVAAAPVIDGVVADVWLVGGGDPLLATAGYTARFRNQPQVRTPIEDLATALVDAGVRRIEGAVVGDESRYDTDRYPDSWPSRFVQQDQSGPLSALTVNDAWVAFPPNPDVRVPDETPAPDPAAFGAAVLTTLLAERGVTAGRPPASGPAPPGAVELATIESPPLVEVLGQMLRESDNQTAELVLKELAVASGRPGTTADGYAVVLDAARRLQLPTAGLAMTDGSGLSPEDRVTCELVQAILDKAGPASDLDGGLAVAGRSGTLSRRFVDSPVAGRLRAKTGTLNQVTGLAGFLTTLPGVEVSFAFVANLPPAALVDGPDLALQDELAAALARYPEGPPLEALGPRPVGQG